MATRRTRNSRPGQRQPDRRRPTSARKRTSSAHSVPRRRKYEFKPDTIGNSWLKKLYMTRQQRLNLAKWGLYGLLCTFLLVIQDVIMSRVSILGATTDLVPMAILLITVLVGSEYGSIFVLVASTLYWFSGSAPGAYTIAVMSILGIGGTLFRQLNWRRGMGSTVITAWAVLLLYEISVFLGGILLGLTRWDRIGYFLLSALLSGILMVPMYPLTFRIGQIGGEPWKE